MSIQTGDPRQRRIAVQAAGVAAVFPVVALVGWVADIPPLRQVLSNAVAMNPLTAIALLSGALSLWLANHSGARAPTASRLLAFVMVGVGLARLMDPLFGGRPGVDLVFYGDQIQQMVPPARMSFSTAICATCIGGSLLSFSSRTPLTRSARLLLFPPALLALLAMAGYLYDTRMLFDIAALKPMALNTATTLLVLCLGIAALPPAVPPVSTLMLPGTAGAAARRLLPAAFLLPFLVGWLRVTAERAGWLDLGSGSALVAVVSAGLMSLLVLLSIWLVQRAEVAQKRHEVGLQESERRLFQILDAMPIGVFVMNRAGRPYYSNRMSQEISGQAAMPETKPEEMSQRYHVYRAGTEEMYPPDMLPGARALRGERVHVVDIEVHRADRIVPVEVWSAPVTDSAGRIEYAISAFSDITERQLARRQIDALNVELQQQVAELAAVNGELETFSYSVSHDLRAPLRAVDGFSRMLVEDHSKVLPPEALRLLDRIRSNVRRMGLLIDDLLRFSRLSRKELEAAPVDMAMLVRSVVEDLTRSHEQSVPVKVGALPRARGDIDLLRQVWTNLIDNGVKYTGKRSDPLVEVGGALDGDEVRYWVKDNGVGFDMTYAGKLFGVFQRLHPQDEFEGTGVGLAIVQRVVHRHGGRVWAAAEPDRGATFSFSLPVGGDHGTE